MIDNPPSEIELRGEVFFPKNLALITFESLITKMSLGPNNSGRSLKIWLVKLSLTSNSLLKLLFFKGKEAIKSFGKR